MADEPSTIKLALITGLSNAKSCQLSAIQIDFLNSLDLPAASKLFLNFPYQTSKSGNIEGPTKVKRIPLWRASINNTLQFMSASTPGYRRLNAQHWKALMDSADKVLLISGSCGLQLINNLLDESMAEKIRVLAFGPTAWRLPKCECVLVQGQKDMISRLFFREVDHVLNEVGHMDYLENKKFRELVNDWICSNVSK